MNIIKKIGTHLKVSDFGTSRQFYLDLGFSPIFEYGPGLALTNRTAPEKYRGITFATDDGNALFEIADGHVAVRPAVFAERVPSSKVSLMVHVGSIEQIMERAENSGIAITKTPVNYHWGTTEIVIRDPDGFILVFIAPTTDEHRQKYPSV